MRAIWKLFWGVFSMVSLIAGLLALTQGAPSGFLIGLAGGGYGFWQVWKDTLGDAAFK